jgi:cystathionine beta-synthase
MTSPSHRDDSGPSTPSEVFTDALQGTEIHDSVLDAIGNTPIIRLRQITAAEQLRCVLAVKHEATNPGGSAKDRPALEMVLAAERSGELQPGGVIVEPTSGNTGVGLAIVAAQRGYQCVFVTTDKVAPEKIALLKAYGAEVIVCPVAVDPEDERSYYKVAERVTVERNAYRPNQYANENNPLAHYNTTGPEIWRQTGGKITHFVAGAGTSGTVTGIARYLKEMNPNIKIIVGDPDRSLFSGGNGRPYMVEGVGEDFYPAAWEPELYDEVIPVSDHASFAMARRVSREEGILIGGSGGLAVVAALEVAKRCDGDAVIVVLNPDSGRGYLSRIYDDIWMSSHGFIDPADSEMSLRDFYTTHGPATLAYVDADATIGQALQHLVTQRIDSLPVCQNIPPFVPSEVRGSISIAGIVEALTAGAGIDTAVAVIVEPRLPIVGLGEAVQVALARMDHRGAVVVFEKGKTYAVLSKTTIASTMGNLK